MGTGPCTGWRPTTLTSVPPPPALLIPLSHRAEALLKAGADGAAKTQYGETPLSIARQSSAKAVIAVLNKYGFA
eukprot:747250-Hanusia_phi.AAC.2